MEYVWREEEEEEKDNGRMPYIFRPCVYISALGQWIYATSVDVNMELEKLYLV
jgi:hypothetical protein